MPTLFYNRYHDTNDEEANCLQILFIESIHLSNESKRKARKNYIG